MGFHRGRYSRLPHQGYRTKCIVLLTSCAAQGVLLEGEEADLIRDNTALYHGYWFAGLDVFHQLHCLVSFPRSIIRAGTYMWFEIDLLMVHLGRRKKVIVPGLLPQASRFTNRITSHGYVKISSSVVVSLSFHSQFSLFKVIRAVNSRSF